MKKTQRNQNKYPGLDPNFNLKIRRELIDQDYIHKLNEAEKDWLNRFNEEYVSANFTHEGKRIHPKKTRTKKVRTTGEKRKIDIYRKDCEDKNNARNRDSFSITKSNHTLKGQSNIKSTLETDRKYDSNETEDMMIRILDSKYGRES